MVFEPPEQSAAGWYPDPYAPGGQIYWNGRTWEPRPGHGAVGNPDDFPNIGDWIGDGFRRAMRRWKALAAIALLTAVPAGVAAQIGLHIGLRKVRVVDNHVIGWTRDRAVPMIIAFVIAGVATSIASLAVASLMLREDDLHAELNGWPFSSELRTAGRACLHGLRLIPRAIGWGLVAVAVAIPAIALLVVCFVASPGLGVLAIFIVIPLMFWLYVRYSFVSLALVDRPGNPFRRSSTVSRGRFWPTFGRILLMGLITATIAGVGNAIGGGSFGRGANSTIQLDSDGRFSSLSFNSLADISGWSIGLAAVVAVAVGIFATGTQVAAMATLYRTRNPEPEPSDVSRP